MRGLLDGICASMKAPAKNFFQARFSAAFTFATHTAEAVERDLVSSIS